MGSVLLLSFIVEIRSSHICNTEDDSEEETKDSNNDVAVREEIVLSTQSIGG